MFTKKKMVHSYLVIKEITVLPMLSKILGTHCVQQIDLKSKPSRVVTQKNYSAFEISAQCVRFGKAHG